MLAVISFGLIFLSIISHAQTRFNNENVYKFSDEIIKNFDKGGKTDFAKAAQDFSFIGDYKNVLLFDGKFRQPYATIKNSDSSFFKKFHTVEAAEYIISRADKERIIIINEAHHFPYHRVFIASLLPGLYAKGFRYYGAETLNFSDSLINERKYPLLSSGYYTAEPQFGNLVRDALTQGFRVFAYEARTKETISNPKLREIEQAKNIQQVLNRDPSAKILIHAGYDHIREDSLGGSWEKAMASRLKELTGINPFTINQEVLTERIDPSLENPFFKMVSVQVPSILLDGSGNVFSGPEGTNYYDVRMCHPRTKYIENRPHWLFNNNRKAVLIDKKKLIVGFPCLVQAYKSNEDPAVAVPVDVIEISSGEMNKPLVLTTGDYKVLIKGIGGKENMIDLSVK
ncbi:hypothetical protein [Chryseolinea sp. H1M3-3]|uniref:hypothetical protein n=1 Tax=Chryseolinea sp. H1M3-3 TaxID=3034144 RepID=UPI0023EE10A8|nr:hypothetical protein [Chryseolinea sp. H1M3-3]